MFPIAPPFLCAKSDANTLDLQLVSGKTTFVNLWGKLVPRNFGPEIDIDPFQRRFSDLIGIPIVRYSRSARGRDKCDISKKCHHTKSGFPDFLKKRLVRFLLNVLRIDYPAPPPATCKFHRK